MYDYTPGISSMLRSSGLEDDGEVAYCVNKITNAYRGKDNADNFRLSVNGKQDDEYEKIRKSGCCGAHDEGIYLKSGSFVKFGFNHGH